MKVWMPGFCRLLDRFQRALDIALLGARQADDARPANFFTDSPHRIEIAVRRRGKAGFDDIDAEFFQLPRDDDFLFRGHARARRLLAVAQRRIENLYYVLVVHFTILSPRGLIRWLAQKQKLPRQGQREYYFTLTRARILRHRVRRLPSPLPLVLIGR